MFSLRPARKWPIEEFDDLKEEEQAAFFANNPTATGRKDNDEHDDGDDSFDVSYFLLLYY